MSANNTYDIPKKQLEVIAFNAAKRQAMRAKYQESIYHPFAKEPAFDEAMQRWTTARLCYDKLFKPTVKNFLFFISATIVPMFIFRNLVKRDRKYREHLIRTGQVSYRDRENKFVN